MREYPEKNLKKPMAYGIRNSGELNRELRTGTPQVVMERAPTAEVRVPAWAQWAVEAARQKG